MFTCSFVYELPIVCFESLSCAKQVSNLPKRKMYSESKHIVPEKIDDVYTEISEKSNEIRAEEAITYYDRIFSSFLASFRHQLKRIKDLKDGHASSINVTSLYDAFKANHDKSAIVLDKLRTAFKSKLFICSNQTNKKVDIFQEFCDFEIEVLKMKEGEIDLKGTVVLYDHLISLLIVSAQIVIKTAFEDISSGTRFGGSNSYQGAVSLYKKAILLQVILKKTLDSVVTASLTKSEINSKADKIIQTSASNTPKKMIEQCDSDTQIQFEKKVALNSNEELIDSDTKQLQENARSSHILSGLVQKQKFFSGMINSLSSCSIVGPVEAEVIFNQLCSLYRSFIHNQMEISSYVVGAVFEEQMKISEDIQKNVVCLQSKLKKIITSNKSSTLSTKCASCSSRLVTPNNLKRPAEPIEPNESVNKSKIRTLLSVQDNSLSSGPSKEMKLTVSSGEKTVSRFDKSTQTEALYKSAEPTKISSSVYCTTPSLESAPSSTTSTIPTKVSNLFASGFPNQSGINAELNEFKLKSLSSLARPIINGQPSGTIPLDTNNQAKISTTGSNASASSNQSHINARAFQIKLPKLNTNIIEVPKITTFHANFSSLSTRSSVNVQPNKTKLKKFIKSRRSPISTRSRRNIHR